MAKRALFDGNEFSITAAITGTEGDDTLYGAKGDDVIYGLGGNDFLADGGGNDHLYGGDGNDRLSAGRGNDYLDGGDGNDFLYAMAGQDELYGGGGNDEMDGGSGHDLLDGGAGVDRLIGGKGDDSYVFGIGYQQDTIYNAEFTATGKSSSNDRILLKAGISADDITLGEGPGASLFILIKGTDDKLTVENHFSLPASSYQIDSIVFADGTVWDKDYIAAHVVMTDDADFRVGTIGDDTFDGLGGDDQFFGHDGNDTLIGGAGNDYMRGENGNDMLYGGLGNDTLIGGNDINLLSGGEGNDKLYGQYGVDTFVFDTALTESNIDKIFNYKLTDDQIRLDDAIFSVLPEGHLNDAFFAANLDGNATDADDYILYEIDTGNLYYDADGNGAGEKVQFAIIGNQNVALTAGEFIVV